MNNSVKKLVEVLLEKKLTIALAESVTCGMATHQLNVVKGTSKILMGSVICYNEEVKSDLLRVSPKLINKFSAESKEVTEALAKNLKKIFSANIYAAVTGLASTGASENKMKPVGTIFFSILYKRKVYNERKVFTGSPLQIKKKAVQYLYKYMTGIINVK